MRPAVTVFPAACRSLFAVPLCVERRRQESPPSPRDGFLRLHTKGDRKEAGRARSPGWLARLRPPARLRGEQFPGVFVPGSGHNR